MSIPGTEVEDPQGGHDAAPAGGRRCGRCQQTFPADPDLAASGWWLCPPCHESLLGHQRPGRS